MVEVVLMVEVVMMVSGVVKRFGLLKIQIFGYCGFLIYIMVTFAFQFVAINCTVVEIFK